MLPTGVTEKTIENISNDNLKDAMKIKAVITDNDNGEVPIPKGANYKEGTESTGVVIEYKGSQFVWVPVPVTATNSLYPKGTTKAMAKVSTGEYAGTTGGLTNYEGILYNFGYFDDDDEWYPYEEPIAMSSSSNGQGTNGYREPATLSSYDTDLQSYLSGIDLTETTFETELKTEYNKMITSVMKYGGFYVGRYETSLSENTIASVAGVTPMSAATNGQMWYGMYDKQKNFSGTESTDTLQSSMIWGSQYDAMLNWMLIGKDKEKVNSTDNGNHSGSMVNTGATTTDKINNIYDLEGNLYEWTLEAFGTDKRADRGGRFIGLGRANSRLRYDPNVENSNDGSRLSLYIK